MDLVNESPFLVASLLWQPRPSAWALTAVCKATFLLEPGEATLAPDQDPPSEEDNHWDDDPERSLWSPSDLAPEKPRADVVLVGSAFAPAGAPVRSLVARLVVGGIEKAIEVVADRAILPDGSVQEGPRFTRMPLVWERAAGGAGSWNPVGVGPHSRSSRGGVAVPNLQRPGAPIGDPAQPLEPVGFGPIAPTWPGRVARLGRLAPTWSHHAWAREPLPEGLDLGYFNAAPPDQQPEALRGDERIVLENLHPQHPRLETRLPGLRPTAILERASGLRVLRVRCDTLWIDADRGRCTLAFRAQIPLESPEEQGQVVLGLDPSSGKRPASDAERATMIGFGSAAPARPEPTVESAPRDPGASAPRSPLASAEAMRTMLASPSGSAGPALPWRAPPDQPEKSIQRVSAPRMTALPFRSPDASPRDRVKPPAFPTTLLSHAIPPPLPAVPPAVPPPAPLPAAAPPPAPPTAGLTVGQMATAAATRGGAPSDASPKRTPAGKPPPLPSHRTAPGGALAASNAAAQAAVVARPVEETRAPEIAPASRVAPSVEIVELLWFDPKALPRVRATWADLALDLDFAARDPRHDLPDDPEAVADRHLAFGVIAGGTPRDPGDLRRAILDAVDDRGRFTPPMVLVSGELRFPFDELETLKATAAVISPLVGPEQKKLRESLDAVGELLATPYLQSSTGVVDRLTRELVDQLAQSNRALPPGHVEALTERILLEQRRYQLRKVFGEEHIRALLAGGREVTTVPVYLPKALEHRLPMLTRMRVQLIAEAHLRQEQHEASDYALRVAAVGRMFRS